MSRPEKPRQPKTARKSPPRQPGGDAASRAMNQATADEFEREGLGIAPKE